MGKVKQPSVDALRATKHCTAVVQPISGLKDEGTATVKKARIAFWLAITASLLFTEQLTATGSSSLQRCMKTGPTFFLLA